MAFTQNVPNVGLRTYYLHTNAHGDVIYITKAGGGWVKKYSYDPWGKTASEDTQAGYESLANPYLYSGYYCDADTGLFYMKARYYSPTLKRFLTKDPASGSKANPSSLNPYAYCLNNPVVLTDPSGQSPIGSDSWWADWRAGIAAASATLASVSTFGQAAVAQATSAQATLSTLSISPMFPNGFSVHVGSCGMSQNSSFAGKVGSFVSSVSSAVSCLARANISMLNIQFFPTIAHGGNPGYYYDSEDIMRTMVEDISTVGLDIAGIWCDPWTSVAGLPVVSSTLNHYGEKYAAGEISSFEYWFRSGCAVEGGVPYIGVVGDTINVTWDIVDAIFTW